MNNIKKLLETLCPNGVEFIKLGDVIEFKNGKGHEKFIDENGEYIVVNSKFISTDGAVIKKSNQQLTPVYKNDLLMVMSDLPNGKALAKVFKVDADNKYTLNQRICGLTLKRNDLYNVDFLYYILNRNKQLLRFDNGSDQTNLRKDDILEIRLPVPPMEVQCEIVHILDNFTLLSAELSAELKARQKQYEYYRNKLLSFEEMSENLDTLHTHTHTRVFLQTRNKILYAIRNFKNKKRKRLQTPCRRKYTSIWNWWNYDFC